MRPEDIITERNIINITVLEFNHNNSILQHRSIRNLPEGMVAIRTVEVYDPVTLI